MDNQQFNPNSFVSESETINLAAKMGEMVEGFRRRAKSIRSLAGDDYERRMAKAETLEEAANAIQCELSQCSLPL